MAQPVRSEFTGPGVAGDFLWMIEQVEYDDCLFVFNDNERQFRAHRARVGSEHRCSAGGGNAAIRSHQCQQPPRACGIPTGDDAGYDRLDEPTRAVIDEAITHLTRDDAFAPPERSAVRERQSPSARARTAA